MWNDKEEKKTIRSQGMYLKTPCFHTTPGDICSIRRKSPLNHNFGAVFSEQLKQM